MFLRRLHYPHLHEYKLQKGYCQKLVVDFIIEIWIVTYNRRDPFEGDLDEQ